jgi:hypothetical protein
MRPNKLRASDADADGLALGDLRFRALVPEADWGRLPLPIRRRFSKRLADGEIVHPRIGLIIRQSAAFRECQS